MAISFLGSIEEWCQRYDITYSIVRARDLGTGKRAIRFYKDNVVVDYTYSNLYMDKSTLSKDELAELIVKTCFNRLQKHAGSQVSDTPRGD